MRGMILILAIFSLIAVLPALAEDPAETIENTTERLEDILDRIGTTEGNIRLTAARERSVLDTLDTMDRETAVIRDRVRDLRAQEKDLKIRITRSEEELRAIKRQRERTAGWLALRSTALYKGGNVSYLKVILAATGIEDLERRSYYLKMLAEHDSEMFTLSRELYHRENRQVETLKSARATQVSTRRDLEETLTVLTRKKEQKSLVLAVVRDEKEKNTRFLKELETSASHLASLLDALKLQAVTGESAFSTLKGSLKRPVSGKVTTSFGRNRNERFSTFTLSNGVTIQSAEGTPVRAVYNGRAIFADWFRGYGRIIILDHGGGYYTLYGHLSELKINVGQEVQAETVIGFVGDSGSLEGAALYFEIRYHGKPIDPSPWFKG
ncbi:MAG: peptidoglycan DD-metalloendopeptidase family protein [bacterium]|nr:peptidoglycan DD-metalloendopeptidase family protein [bacterium]MDT8396829.1 peptidoglycan DD-metalloendopeptidase family protein [bacterium]